MVESPTLPKSPIKDLGTNPITKLQGDVDEQVDVTEVKANENNNQRGPKKMIYSIKMSKVNSTKTTVGAHSSRLPVLQGGNMLRLRTQNLEEGNPNISQDKIRANSNNSSQGFNTSQKLKFKIKGGKLKQGTITTKIKEIKLSKNDLEGIGKSQKVSKQ